MLDLDRLDREFESRDCDAIEYRDDHILDLIAAAKLGKRLWELVRYTDAERKLTIDEKVEVLRLFTRPDEERL